MLNNTRPNRYHKSLVMGLLLFLLTLPCAAVGDSGLIYYGNGAAFGGSATDPGSIQGFTGLRDECSAAGLPTTISDVFPVALGDLRLFVATAPTIDFDAAQVATLQSLLASGGVVVVSHDGLVSPAQNNLLASLGSTMVFSSTLTPSGTDIGTVVDDNDPLMTGLTNGDRFCSFSPGDITSGLGLVQDSIGDNIISVEMVGGGAIVAVADFDIINNAPILFWPIESCTAADVLNILTFQQNLCEYELDIQVDIDIKFCSDPNAFNCKKKGVLPVTIFGTVDFNVEDIDISSLQLCTEDLSSCTNAPRNWSVADRGDPTSDLGAAMCAIIEVEEGIFEEQDYLNQDGFLDLDAAFEASEVQDMLGTFCSDVKGASSEPLIITGTTLDGTMIFSVPVPNVGTDQLWKVNK